MKLMGFYRGSSVSKLLRQVDKGSVLGIFHRGWYIDCGVGLLLIHDRSYGGVPNGIGVEGFLKNGWYPKNLEGSSVRIGSNSIQIEDFTILFREEKEVTHLPLYATKADMASLAAYAEEEARFCNKGELWRALTQIDAFIQGALPEWEMQGSPLYRAMELSILEFLNAMDIGNKHLVESSLKKMIGLGTGLTPSMDDWLNGFLYAGKRIPMAEYDRAIFQQLCSCVESPVILDRTNYISASYLKATLHGEHYALLDQVLFRKQLVPQYTVLDIGSSSGMDILTGMAFACKYYGSR